MADTPTAAPASSGGGGGVPMGTLGLTGLRQFGGWIQEEFLPQLRGLLGYRTFREMGSNDSVCGAILFAITMLIRQASWEMQPANDTPAAQEAADLVDEMLDDMRFTWQETLTEILSMLQFGYAPMEIVWKRRQNWKPDPRQSSKFSDGLVAPALLSLRSQETIIRWDIDPGSGEILGVFQQWNSPLLYIPINKLLLFRTTAAKNNPEGQSVLRTAWRSWVFKKRVEEIEGVGLERDLIGYPVLKIPGKLMSAAATAQEQAAYAVWQKFVTELRRDQHEGAIIPSDVDPDSKHPLYELTLMSAGSSRRVIDTNQIVDRYDRRIATAVLADFIFLGQAAVGSFALSSDKTALFATAIGAFLDIIAAGINTGLIAKIWRYNGFDEELRPAIRAGDIEKPNLQELGTYIQSLASAGMPLFPDRDLENNLRDKGGLPPAPEEGTGDPIAVPQGGASAPPEQPPANPQPKPPTNPPPPKS
jgi:hypothetical protein